MRTIIHDLIIKLLQFVAGGVLMGTVFGIIVYFGSSNPSRLQNALGIAMIPVAFVLIYAVPMAKQIWVLWRRNGPGW